VHPPRGQHRVHIFEEELIGQQGRDVGVAAAALDGAPVKVDLGPENARLVSKRLTY
jgi:hypothetical protein